eukprot:TRINITY_DN29524_c0_g2_i1.p3 TRINITY_DN29524_c0_g2~~TRINITY_DN29524_c0_g2_i1.p3  ORF type:complete len:154 (-),score=69.48 TRINITY_DN29524_c0_g2_i1:42-503(-)
MCIRDSVYTIGPSLYEDKPVVGVVTFLAKDDRIERFVLTTDDDRLAHYPRKVHVREDNVTFDAPAGPLAGTTTLPPEGSGNSGVVFLSGDRCVDPGLIRGVTRSLATNNLASLIIAVRGCDGEQGEPHVLCVCLLYTSPSPRDRQKSRMPSSA